MHNHISILALVFATVGAVAGEYCCDCQIMVDGKRAVSGISERVLIASPESHRAGRKSDTVCRGREYKLQVENSHYPSKRIYGVSVLLASTQADDEGLAVMDEVRVSGTNKMPTSFSVNLDGRGITGKLVEAVISCSRD